jgi:hypothetical protein
MRPRAFNPVWDFTLQFPVGPGYSARDTTVRVQVVDYDGPTRFDTLGSTVISVDELLAKPLHQLGAFGSVKQLTVEVATIEVDDPKPEPSVFRIAVPGNAKWTDTGVELTAGQRVAIDAADEVCTSGEKLSACSGPEGQRKTSSYNLPGFDSLGHGALVAALGDTRFSIGRDRTFIAPSSGRLRLGVNDTKSDDNRGAYAVRIKVDSGL